MKIITFLLLPALATIFLYFFYAPGSGVILIGFIFVVAYLIACSFSLPILFFLVRTKRISFLWFLLGGGLSTIIPYIIVSLKFYIKIFKIILINESIKNIITSKNIFDYFCIPIIFFAFGSFCGGIYWLVWTISERKTKEK